MFEMLQILIKKSAGKKILDLGVPLRKGFFKVSLLSFFHGNMGSLLMSLKVLMNRYYFLKTLTKSHKLVMECLFFLQKNKEN